MNAFDITQMNERIAERLRAAEGFVGVPVRGPSWAGRVVDTGDELIAVHNVTASSFPLDLFKDLEPEEVAVVLVRRVLAAGGTRAEAERLIDALALPGYAQHRLRSKLAGEVA